MKYRAYKYRLYPNKQQKVLLAKHFGCCRFIYNYALDKKVKAYQKDKTNLSRFDIQADLPKVNYPQTKDLWALDVEKSSCIGHDNISHLSWVFTYPHVAMLRAALTSASATLPQCAQRKCLPCLMPM